MLLEVRDLRGGYGKKDVLYGVSLSVEKGEIVVLVGHNGSGKTTTLKTIFGLLKAHDGEIVYKGSSIFGQSTSANVARGICLVPQTHAVFADLSVADNLELAAYTCKSKSESRARLATVFQLFPILQERVRQSSATLSGGQQRMLSLGMALMQRPQLLLLDEPSLGLAPVLVQRVMETIVRINQEFGTAILLVEQSVKKAIGIAHRVYVLRAGQILLEESGKTMAQREQFWELF